MHAQRHTECGECDGGRLSASAGSNTSNKQHWPTPAAQQTPVAQATTPRGRNIFCNIAHIIPLYGQYTNVELKIVHANLTANLAKLTHGINSREHSVTFVPKKKLPWLDALKPSLSSDSWFFRLRAHTCIVRQNTYAAQRSRCSVNEHAVNWMHTPPPFANF